MLKWSRDLVAGWVVVYWGIERKGCDRESVLGIEEKLVTETRSDALGQVVVLQHQATNAC